MRGFFLYHLFKLSASDEKGRKNLERMNRFYYYLATAIVIFFIGIVFLVAHILITSSSKTEETEAPTAVPEEVQPAGVKNMAPPTAVPEPTIDPKLLIRYSDKENTANGIEEHCLIKGNINSKGEKIYHVPGSSSYASTKIDTKAGERWFCTEYDALRAGWHAPGQ